MALSVSRLTICSRCLGSGQDPRLKGIDDCRQCNGIGSLAETDFIQPAIKPLPIVGFAHDPDVGPQNPRAVTISGGEVTVVDPTTGGMKGAKLSRFSLIPRDWLWAMAEHYGKGAKKYTRYGECSCVETAKSLEQLILENAVVPVTKSGFGKTIQSSQRSNATIVGSGENETLKGLKNWTEFMEVGQLPKENALRVAMESVWKNMILSYPSLVGFAGKQTNLDTLITVILQAASGAHSVTDAILQLDSLKNVGPNGSTKHWDGCKALQVEKTGDRNWERGYKWSLTVDAHDRHMNQWLLGEDNDPETGSSHLIAAAWHLIALWWFHRHGKGTDDVRPSNP